MHTKSQVFIAELVGTFVLVFAGCGTAIFAGAIVGWLGVAFAFGLSLLIMAYAIGPISGCHINPAVSIGLAVARKIPGSMLLLYIVAQLVGAVLAGAGLWLIASGVTGWDISQGFATNGYGAHSPGGFNLLSCLVAEIILTFFLVFTVLATTHPKFPAGFAGIPIGFVLLLIHLVDIPITNASVNPARSIGVAVFQGGWALGQLWLFIVAPTIGALLAVVIYRLLRAKV
jgi:aquaporin Z